MGYHEFDPNSYNAVLAETRTILRRVEKRLDSGDEDFKDIRKEIESLKKWRWTVTGAAGAIGFILAKAWEWFVGGGGTHKP